MSSMSSELPRDACSNCIFSSAPSRLGVVDCLEQLKGKSSEQHHNMSMEIADSSKKPIDLRALGRASQSQASQGSNASWVCGFVTMAMTNVKLCWPPWLEWGRHCICW